MKLSRNVMKKKIIIFTSAGGGGHLSVSHALTQALEPEYTVVSSLILSEVLKPIDPAHVMSGGLFSGEEYYNALIRNGWSTTMNVCMPISLRYFSLRKHTVKKLIRAHIESENPHLLISVAPFFNGTILELAQEMNIPFILTPTDLDARTFLYNMENNQNKFTLALSFNNERIRSTMPTVKNDYLKVTGFPLKKSFSEPKDKELIKQQWNIPQGKPIILVVMGAQGSQALVSYAQELSQLSHNAHILFCLGKSAAVATTIERLPFKQATYSCIGFTDRMADLMYISDLIITKSGTVSVCEALYTNVPMILDATNKVLRWEQFNHEFITQQGFGYSLKESKSLLPLLDTLLSTPALETIKNKIVSFEKKCGTQEIKQLVQELLG